MAEERVQRRLVAILVADVVGYSRMMREDEAGTLAQLKTLRKEVIRRQGDWRRHFDRVNGGFEGHPFVLSSSATGRSHLGNLG